MRLTARVNRHRFTFALSFIPRRRDFAIGRGTGRRVPLRRRNSGRETLSEGSRLASLPRDFLSSILTFREDHEETPKSRGRDA